MAIGNWGSVIRFEVTSRKVLTFHISNAQSEGDGKATPLSGKSRRENS